MSDHLSIGTLQYHSRHVARYSSISNLCMDVARILCERRWCSIISLELPISEDLECTSAHGIYASYIV